MKRKILISLLVLLSAAGFAEAFELSGSGINSEEGLTGYKRGELIVRFADPAPGSQPADGPTIVGPMSRQAIRNAISDHIITGAVVDRAYDNVSSGLAVIDLPEDTSVLDAFIKFNLSANIRYAEPNYKYKLLARSNMTGYPELWGTDEIIQGSLISANSINSDSSSIIVAVTDTGIDYEHPDLVDNLWVNTAEMNGTPGVDDDGNGYIDDIYGYDFAGAIANDPDSDSDPKDTFFHGTHVTGIINTIGKNSVDILGSKCVIETMALKIFADDYALEPEVFADDAVEAIGYAIDNGAKIINGSWGGEFYSQSLYDAIRDAGDAGVLFVAAAGNDYGNDNDINPVYPASFDLDNIISVTSKDNDGQLSIFSNYGASSVDIAEPGIDILSTTPTYETFAMAVYGVSMDHDYLSGTSMAAPHAAASTALLWSQYPSLPAKSIKNLLLNTAEPVSTPVRLSQSNGSINLQKALLAVPSGGPGKILNATRDDPNDPNDNLYDLIQQAIDEAIDGDELIVEAGVYKETIDFKGKAITLRSGDVNNPDDQNINPEETFILGATDPEVPVVTFITNEGPGTILKGLTIGWGSAEYGGGISCEYASPTITDCIITNNTSFRRGGGIDCYYASPVIINCQITENFSEDIGGGIACYSSNPTITNCLIANNAAVYEAGGIALDISSPIITNCTVIIDEPDAPKDGGIFAYNDSEPVITNCIIWGNGDDLYNCSATYSDIEDNDKGAGNIHVDPVFTDGPLGKYYLIQESAGQLVSSPCVDAGSDNADNFSNLTGYSTRTDGVDDDGIVDMGYHYRSLGTQYVELRILEVIDNVPVTEDQQSRGHIVPDPNGSPYEIRKYEIVNLTAVPNQGYRIKAWVNTDDDSSKEPYNQITMIKDTFVAVEFEEIPKRLLQTEIIGGHGTIKTRDKTNNGPIIDYQRRGIEYNDGTVIELIAVPDQGYIVDQWQGTDDDTLWSLKNTITLDSDKKITVTFRRPKTLHVPIQYPDISDALNAAHTHGDSIIVSAGTYSGIYDFQGKAVILASEHPDDPCTVADTIIISYGSPVFRFQSNEGKDSIIDGFTIQGQGDPGYMPIGDIEGNIDGAADGSPAFGGAIFCGDGSSPTLSNLVIKDCVARGRDGLNNVQIHDEPDDPADAEEAEEPMEPLEPPEPIEAPEDTPVNGIPGEDGADGADGMAGEDGEDGLPGDPGGNGGDAYGGAMYFEGNNNPIIRNCKIIGCKAIGGDGGYGGAGQNGQGGQDGQPGQDGQDGQDAADAQNNGIEAPGGNGGAGGDGGPGGNGGAGGDGGKGGDGGTAIGGAIFFGPNCNPQISSCKIMDCLTRQGMGNYGGDGGNGGDAGAGAAPGAGGGGGSGEPEGEDGEDGAEAMGGMGGDGGRGGNMGVNGPFSWAGAIYFGENCDVVMKDTAITGNAATTIVPSHPDEYTYGGGDGGDGGDGGAGEGDAAGGDAGAGGNGGWGGPFDPTIEDEEDDDQEEEDDPNDVNLYPGDGGPGGVGGEGGMNGADGEDGIEGMNLMGLIFTTSYGGANYYDYGCKVELTNCTIGNNSTRQTFDGTGQDGGGEFYQSECEAILNSCEFINNTAGINTVGSILVELDVDIIALLDDLKSHGPASSIDGYGGGQNFNENCFATINDCNYINNSSGGDGGGLYTWYDCTLDVNNSSFIGNSTLGIYSSGGGIYAGGDRAPYGPDTGWYNGGTVTINNSVFGNNTATFGGAAFWHGNEAQISVTRSVINNNIAEHGGGLFWASGTPLISECTIIGNQARIRVLSDDITNHYGDYEWPYGGGAGIFSWNSDAIIENSLIKNNQSVGSGGGIYFGGYSDTPAIKNCLIKGNSAVLDGGGVVSYWFSNLTISNCTIVENKAFDPNNSTTHGRGGGLSCAFGSQTTLVNSILWDNTGSKGNQIAIGNIDEPAYLDPTTALTVKNSNIKGGRYAEAIYTEPGRSLKWISGTNISSDPLFVENTYYLSQTAAGQNETSPCVDAGSNQAVNFNLNNFTTRLDGVGDSGKVDMGYHYPLGKDENILTVKVIGSEHGSVRPLGGTFPKDTPVKLTATVDLGYEVRWIGTDDDSSNALTNTVTMDSDKTVIVEFAKYAQKTITVPGNYTTLQEAVFNALDGDTIILDPGRHFGGYFGQSIEVTKSITITSKNPDDPCCVAATIIDGYRGSNEWTSMGFLFSSETDSKTVLNGITIENCGGSLITREDGERDDEDPLLNHPDGYDGGCAQGAAIYIDSGASPIIKNCIIRNNFLEAGNGGDGVDADSDNNAGRGGWGGWVHGGAIYCGLDSSPKFINCIIENNEAHGGDGGIGGDGGGDDEGFANYGGNWSRSQGWLIDSTGLNITYVTNNLWENMTWDFAGRYGPIYDMPILTSYIGNYRLYSAYGAGAYCDIRSNVTFDNCTIRGNRTAGGMSGTGGVVDGARNLEPLVAYELPSYGAGVYCAADSLVTFTECIFEDNIASEPVDADGADPNHTLDPYVGYGGGVAAEKCASVVFTDCNFIDNESDSGGAIYIADTTVTITDSNMTSNTSLRGGGLCSISSLVTLRNNNITNNTATIDVNDPNDSGIPASGAGIFCASGGLLVEDCNFAGNSADFSGGGAYIRDLGNAFFINNIFANNGAGRDGGGASVNWYTSSLFSNCTFTGNAAVGDAGENEETGLGGGLYCSYLSDCTVTNSIFWDNFAQHGTAAAVGTGFEFDRRPATMTVSYSDIKNGRAGIWVDDSCTLNWGEGNINDDPMFVAGPLGRYYLSQISSGQPQNSLCVDAGSDSASILGLTGFTTRTDELTDTHIVDLGFHYPSRDMCSISDLAFDGMIDFQDYAVLASNWQRNDCSELNNWCQGADITSDSLVNIDDVAFLVSCWLVADMTGPTPDPSEWETEPYLTSGTSISMTAKTATDFWGWPVEYYFECIGITDCNSGWQTSPTYTATNLTPDTAYGFRVRTRDGVRWIPDDGTNEPGNKSQWSTLRYAGRDNIPPAPAPYIETIIADSETSISMVATTAYDDSGVEYYFESTTTGGNDSGWQEDPNYTDVGLDPNTEYGYRVKARDNSPNMNETDWSAVSYVTTIVPGDLDPPTPDPMEWDMTEDANGVTGLPREVIREGSSTSNTWVEMRAVTATDASGFVEYYFQCTTESGFSSGWIATPIYAVQIGRPGQGHMFRVMARDAFGNETAWSTEERAIIE